MLRTEPSIWQAHLNMGQGEDGPAALSPPVKPKQARAAFKTSVLSHPPENQGGNSQNSPRVEVPPGWLFSIGLVIEVPPLPPLPGELV